MVSYNVVISPKALSQLNDYIDYIQYTLFNSQAAEAVWSDALETTVRLETIAGSLQPCSHPKLKEYGYYPILFTDHNDVIHFPAGTELLQKDQWRDISLLGSLME